MNIINKVFLKLALLPSGVYRQMGVNIPQLKAILNTKLTIDDRRPGSIQQTRKRKSNKPVSLATLGTMFMSALLGLLFLFSFYIGQDKVTQLTFYFSMFFFMLSATLISDFTSVLIDVRDTFIILPKPVNDRTVLVARLLHIFIHICKIVLPMGLPGVIYIGYQVSVAAALVLLLVIFFVTLFAIFFINAVYILILRITTPQKFQSIISYIQIVFAIVIYAGYQIIPRIVSRLNLDDFTLASKPGIIYYPIYWFANSWNVLQSLQGTSSEIIMATAGFLLPLASLFIVIRYLAPAFNNKLAMINNSAAIAAPQPATVKTVLKPGFSYAEFLSKLFTRSHAEKMGFLFTWKMTARSRDFKMKVYPSIGYLIVYVVIMFMNNKRLSLAEIAEQETKGKVIIISALYFTSLLLTMALNQIIYSEKYKASWIYYVTPVSKPGEVILGGAKAAIFKFYIPLVFFITVAGVVIVGPSILPNIMLGLFNELLIATLLVYIGNKMFPFSLHQNTSAKTGSFMRSLSVLFFSGIIAFGHYLIYNSTPAVLLCAALSIIATWLMMGSVKNVSWEAIKSSYED
jgi:ABC-2 type transport system permease protein